MFTSARKSMPAIDYVSIVRSVYGDRRALIFGAVASAVIAAISAYTTQSLALYLVAAGFVVVGIVRYWIMDAFIKADIGPEDTEAAEYWENQALVGGGLVALLHGIWCIVSFLIVGDPYAEFASVTLSIAASVGIVARNFGLDRLVTVQTLLLCVPVAIALLLGESYYPLLGLLLVIMLVSHRKLAGDIRTILLAAVHGRVEASRLAAELDISLTTMNHGVIMLDEAGLVTVLNERTKDIFDPLGMTLKPGDDLISIFEKLRDDKHLPHDASNRLLSMVATNGSGKVVLSLADERHYEVTISSRRERSVLLFEDISERVEAQERIRFMAGHDALTTLPNRAYFTENAAQDLVARRNGTLSGLPDRKVALAMIDIDDFKHINDSMGHLAGDRLLREVSERLRRTLAPQCTLARFGGDEFVAYVPNIASSEAAENLASILLSAFDKPFDLGSVCPLVSASIGVVVSSHLSDDLDSLLAKADLALYAAKADGKHKTQLFHADMDVNYQYRQRLKFDLSEAVSQGDLSLAYQPLIDLASGKVVGCEALARWTHPTLGIIPPSTFIPLAEEMGLISSITDLVLRQATLEAMRWPGEISVAVNVSARDFRSSSVGDMVCRALKASKLPAERLEIEVTESALIEQRDVAIDVLKSLADRGIAIALDDFGTGYSSLSYLQALPFTKLKIDRSFLTNIATDTRALNLLANVAKLGSELDMAIIAEGVETDDQLEIIRTRTKVQQVQGYLFSRPLPARDIREFIERFNGARDLEQNPSVLVNRH